MTLEEALHNNNMNEIMDSMTAYAYGRIKTIGVKDLEGKTPEDLVGEVLLKVKEIGQRQNVLLRIFFSAASKAICIIISNPLNRNMKQSYPKLKVG